MLRVTNKLDNGPSTTKRHPSAVKPKYFVSSKNLLPKSQLVAQD